jgi:hypothetical protein
MSSSTRFSAVALFTLLCIPLSLNAQTPTKAPAKTPRGSVSGRVTIKDKPAPGVTVGLRVTNGMIPQEKFYRGISDQEGVYHITNLPAGTYDIAPAAPAYVVAELNGPRGKSVIVGDDEEIEDINFSLVRGGVITGKITDADGRPLIQQQVMLYRAGDFQQQPVRQVYPAGNIQTDDRGIYRFFGLAAGRYKVASGRGDENFGNNYYQPSRLIYKQVFHPDATDQTKATIIEVREGSEANNVDIALGAPIQTFTVSGRVIEGEKGAPVPNIRFAFQRRAGESFEIAESMGVSNSGGDFVVEGLIPGKYAVLQFANPSQDFRVDSLWFDVIDQDVTGLTVRLIKASSVSGMVVLEPEDKKAFGKLTELQLRGYITAPSGSPVAAQTNLSEIGPDGSFRLQGLSPGQLNMWLTAEMGMNTPKGFSVVRVEHNGVVMPRLEIKDGDQLTGVKLVVSYGTASVHGSVKIENGTLPEGARMMARLFKPGVPPTNVGASQVDARGQFLIEGIPAGVYELSVMVFAQNLKTPPTAKREINVQDGVMNEVSITIDLTTLQPKP